MLAAAGTLALVLEPFVLVPWTCDFGSILRGRRVGQCILRQGRRRSDRNRSNYREKGKAPSRLSVNFRMSLILIGTRSIRLEGLPVSPPQEASYPHLGRG